MHNIKKVMQEYLLNVDIDIFIKDMQSAIDQCPQGINDGSAKWASYHKDRYYRSCQPKNDCIQWRLDLFTLRDSRTLTSDGYFQFLSNKSKEVHQYAKMYQHLEKIESLTSMSK